MTVVTQTPSIRSSNFATATAPPPRAVKLQAPTVTLPADLLDGGEVVILAIKPSLWFMVFEPAKWIAAAALLLVCIPWVGPPVVLGLSQYVLIQLVLLTLGVRMLVSAMRWVSRFHVLTNRRVMSVHGVLRPHVWGCPLVRVQNTRLTASVHERVVKLGTLEFFTDEHPAADRRWCYIARPEEAHTEVRRAISRALDNHPVT